jgi:SAM-dependent methyltransferase
MTSNWSSSFFDDVFAEYHLKGSEDGDIADTIAFLRKNVGLKKGDRIFDQCCGTGRLCFAFAEIGCRVFGVDIIDSYIAFAKGEAARRGLSCVFEAGDAYQYVTPEPCDIALNWWTSFGYTPDDMQNIKMLQRIYDSLKPGGYMALDYMNGLKRMLDLRKTPVLLWEENKNGSHISWETRMDQETFMLMRKWTCKKPDGSIVVREGGGAKVYTPHEIRTMLEKSGFTDIVFYGSVAGEAWNENSPRCIAVARKA